MKVNNPEYLFFSPVTGRILCTAGKWLQGNAEGIAVPVPVFPIGGLPDLTFKYQWVGDETNRPIEKQYLGSIPFIVRLSTPLIPNSQALEPLGLGLIKVIEDGVLAHAVPLLDYATVAYEAILIPIATQLLVDATNSKITAVAAKDAARISAEGAAAFAIDADNSATSAHDYYILLLGITLNQLPNFGDVNMNFYRLKNIKQSPVEDADLISMQFLWDMMHDEVDIVV